METFLRFLAVAVAVSLLGMTLRAGNRPYGTAFSLVAGAALLLALMEPLREAADALRGIADAAEIKGEHAALAAKMLGIAFAAEFAAQACRDAGEEGIAMRVELSAKLALVILSAPLLKQMAQLILELTA